MYNSVESTSLITFVCTLITIPVPTAWRFEMKMQTPKKNPFYVKQMSLDSSVVGLVVSAVELRQGLPVDLAASLRYRVG